MSVESRTAEAARVSPPHPASLAVLETSRIVELMELAAARLLLRDLRDGEESIAVETELTHLAWSSAGAWRVVAKRQGVSGRLHRFTVNVFDESGLIASAAHTRALVSRRRLLGLARRRAGLPSMQLGV